MVLGERVFQAAQLFYLDNCQLLSLHTHQLGRIQNHLEEMEEMRVRLNQQEGLIANLVVCLVRVERRARRRHERERESHSSSMGSSYRSFHEQAWNGEGSADDPIVEREVIIHTLVPEENEEPVLVPEPSPSCRPLVERIGGRELVKWNSGEIQVEQNIIVSVLNLWVKFFAFDKVSIPTITRSLGSRLLTLAFIPSLPFHAHAKTRTRR